jgi:uncharacterized protein
MAPAISRFDINATLSSAPINPGWIVSGAPIAANFEISRSKNTLTTCLLWECSPGRFRWHYNEDETILILAGRIVLDDGSGPVRMGQGDIVFFPSGTTVNWIVEEHVRKLACLHGSIPLPFGLACRLWRRLIQLRGRIKLIAQIAARRAMGSDHIRQV